MVTSFSFAIAFVIKYNYTTFSDLESLGCHCVWQVRGPLFQSVQSPDDARSTSQYASKCCCEICRWQRRCLAQRGIPRLGCRLIDTRDLTDPNCCSAKNGQKTAIRPNPPLRFGLGMHIRATCTTLFGRRCYAIRSMAW